MTRLSLATFTAFVLAAPVVAAQTPATTPDTAGPTPTIMAQCPGKPPVNA